LWDQTLALPTSTPINGQSSLYEIAGPDDKTPVVKVGTIRPADNDAAFRLFIAEAQQALIRSMQQFRRMLAISLGILDIGLTLAAIMQVLVGLRPLASLHKRLADVHDRKAARIEGKFPSEVQPLAEDFNQVLTENEQIILRVRTQAGNLAHSVKTPLTVIANAAAHETTPFGQLVREQLASARQQIDHHLARARAAAAEQAAKGTISLRTP